MVFNREFNLKYGNKKIIVKLPDKNIAAVLSASKIVALENPASKLNELLERPINTDSLDRLIKTKKAKKLLILVNDVTRPTPYNIILPPLLTKLEQVGVKKENIIFIIATGAHRGNTREENIKIFGEELVSSYNFINHSCDENLLDLGRLSSGNRLLVDSIVKEVDFIITTGVIVPHYIAGFSGGRKSILPAICGRETIEKNHANMIHPNAVTGNLIDNPVHEEMTEAAKRVGVDFNINVITDEDGNIIDIVAGDLSSSWDRGVEICKDTYFAPIKQKSEVVIVSTGGYPKDINMYQAQKALENAFQAVKTGGTIILLAECNEGLGNSIFEKWVEEANSIADIENRIKERFVLGGHKAYAIARVAKEVDIILISSLIEEKVKKLFMKPMKNIDSAIDYVRKKHGDDFKSYIIPSGNTVFPYTVKAKKD
ncbi:MAG: nickel-dependent lactate racemase [Atribacterota bacterium]